MPCVRRGSRWLDLRSSSISGHSMSMLLEKASAVSPLARLKTSPALATVCGVWAVMLAVILVRGYVVPQRNTVYPIFSNAAREWTQSVDIYDVAVPRFIDKFRYAPIVAVSFVPL